VLVQFSKRLKSDNKMVGIRLPQDRLQLIVVAMVALYAGFFLYFTLSKHFSYMTYMFDLGIYDHNLWSVLNFGDPLFPFGMVHQSLLLYLMIPLYALNPRAETLLIIQALIVPVGAIFLYKLGRREVGSGLAALVLALFMEYLNLTSI